MELVELSKEDMLKAVRADIERMTAQQDYSDRFYQLLFLEYKLRNLYRRKDMGNKSMTKEYELGHSYDFDDFSTPEGKKFTKQNSHRRVRRRLTGSAAIKKILTQFFSEKE